VYGRTVDPPRALVVGFRWGLAIAELNISHAKNCKKLKLMSVAELVEALDKQKKVTTAPEDFPVRQLEHQVFKLTII